MDQLSDRRRHTRVPFTEEVHILSNDTALPRCPSFDISKGGIRLATSLPVDTRLHLVITLPLINETQTLVLEGKVCWRRLNSCGVSFMNLSSQARVYLYEFILTRSESQLN